MVEMILDYFFHYQHLLKNQMILIYRFLLVVFVVYIVPLELLLEEVQLLLCIPFHLPAMVVVVLLLMVSFHQEFHQQHFLLVKEQQGLAMFVVELALVE
jgi:hypothetical protein